MKRFANILIATAAVSLAFASCSKLNEAPVFKAEDSFAYFVNASAKVKETDGKVVIPVSIAALENQVVDVKYNLIDSSAKKDVDYKVIGDGVLKFDGKSDTQNIEVEIVDRSGEFTRDLVFVVEIASAGKLKIGNSNSCTVTIQDLDHPLASILGDYAAAGTCRWDGPQAWTLSIDPDPKDLTVIWITNIAPVYGTQKVYANVTTRDDGTVEKFVIPDGQWGQYSSYPMTLVGAIAGDTLGYFKPGITLTYEQKEPGVFTYVPYNADFDTWGVLIYNADKATAKTWWTTWDVVPVFTKI